MNKTKGCLIANFATVPWSAQEYADYEHYAEASDYDFDSSIYDDYAMPQTSQAEQSHTGKEHTHEHEEGGHEI
ncbi:hypothetical protein [Escherichia coli]|uniref:hypothetical protein n=1 Tax=Escherichia coli TaxID=562 RepID=UPI00112F36A4|nr:hypothetical protein [Escherichia coli]